MENPNEPTKPGTIEPDAVYTGAWGLWLAECFRNSAFAFCSAKSRSFTDTTRSEMAPIDYIGAEVAAYHYESSWILCGDNERYKSDSAEAYCSKFYCDPFLPHRIESDHTFQESGYVSWYPSLTIEA